MVIKIWGEGKSFAVLEAGQTRRRRAEARLGAALPNRMGDEAGVGDLDRYMFDLNGFIVIKGASPARSPQTPASPPSLAPLPPYGCPARADAARWAGAVGPDELAVLNAAVDRNDPHHGSEGGLPAEEAAALLKVASDAERDWSDPEVLAATAEQQGFGEGAPTLGTDPCFEALIDHPGWISHIRDFIGGADGAAFLSMGCIIRKKNAPAAPAVRVTCQPALMATHLRCALRRQAGRGRRPESTRAATSAAPRRSSSTTPAASAVACATSCSHWRTVRSAGVGLCWSPALCAEAPCALAGG